METRQKVPYGYRIIDGRAMVDHDEAIKLKKFFSLYLEGASMAEAGRLAELPVSTATYPHLLVKKEYAGTDFYPAIITEACHERLVQERTRQREANCARGIGDGKRARKKVTIYRKFCWASGDGSSMESASPAQFAAELYSRIAPVKDVKAAESCSSRKGRRSRKQQDI